MKITLKVTKDWNIWTFINEEGKIVAFIGVNTAVQKEIERLRKGGV